MSYMYITEILMNFYSKVHILHSYSSGMSYHWNSDCVFIQNFMQHICGQMHKTHPHMHSWIHTQTHAHTNTHIHTNTCNSLSHMHTHTHTHTCKCHQTWTLKIIWNYNAKTRTRVCEIALANRGHPRRVCDISLANRGLTPATLLFWGFYTCIHMHLHSFAPFLYKPRTVHGCGVVLYLILMRWFVSSIAGENTRTHTHNTTHSTHHTTYTMHTPLTCSVYLYLHKHSHKHMCKLTYATQKH